MAYEFKMHRMVEFAETDMAGILHFSNYFRFMEAVEHAFFRSLGRSISETQPDGTVVGWPRVSAACSFKAPAFYEDEIEIVAIVDRIGVKSLTLRYDFLRDQTLLAKGTMKIVCCVFRPGGPMTSIPTPPDFAILLEEDPEAA